jgi:hypothetical protein
VKATLSYAMCSIVVQGIEMRCPLCGVLVKSGTSHACSKPEQPTIEAKTSAKRKRK